MARLVAGRWLTMVILVLGLGLGTGLVRCSLVEPNCSARLAPGTPCQQSW